jgi:predicted transcriptional regulator of viral defense system
VAASRYVSQGAVVRLKPDLFMLKNRIESMSREESFRAAAILQTPSYVSFTTALSFHEISTQQQLNFVESAALKRTKRIEVEELTFTFTRLKEEFYGGFERRDDYFIALPEKALADAVYLHAMGRYTFDFHAVLFRKVDLRKTASFLENTNSRVQKFWENVCRNSGM